MRLIKKSRCANNEDIKCLFKDGVSTLNNLKECSVDLIVTDPPYKTTSRGNAGTSGGMMQTDICKKGQMFKHNDLVPKDYAKSMFRVLRDGSHCYVMCNHVNLQEMINSFTAVGFHFVKSLIWDKGNKIMGKFYMSQFEYILFFRKGRGVQINDCGTSDILRVPNKKPKDSKGSVLHVTAKPVELMEILIRNSSKEGELVVDPFAGIFTTAIACKKLKRKFIGCEIDKQYFEIGLDLLNNKEIKDMSKYGCVQQRAD